MTISLQRLESLLAGFAKVRIGLLGDLFLDRYLELVPGSEEYSVETDLEAYQIEAVRNAPGALGTLLSNLAALGVQSLHPVTVIGEDGHGFDLLRELRPLPVDLTYVIQSPERLTPTYTKPLRTDSTGKRVELNRLDVRTRAPLTNSVKSHLRDGLQAVFESVDGLIVLDQISEQDCGVVNVDVRAALQELFRAAPEKFLIIDSRAALGEFSFGHLKGNQSEFLAAGSGATTPHTAAAALAAKTGHTSFCTLGESGLLIADPGEEVITVPGYHVDGEIDIVGAGDSATSAIIATRLAGGTNVEAAVIANLVASITVQQLGTTGTASPEEVVSRWRETQSGVESTT